MYPELLNKITEALGHHEALRRIKEYRAAHDCSLTEAVQAVAAQIGVQPTITEEQVKTAIAVLRAYAAETLQIDSNDLVDELDAAIEAAFDRRMTDIECGVDCDIDVDPTYEPPQARSA